LPLLPLALALLLSPVQALAPPPATAVRTSRPPTIDGHLDDDVWQSAVVIRNFVQRYPIPGGPASEPTEVRVLYDDRALYLGVRCFDSHAAEVRPRLGRRDNPPESDVVAVGIDPFHDRHSAYYFTVNSAGVQSDAIMTDGQNDNWNWDGVWDAATSVDATGWTAEIEIPLATLRFRDVPRQEWGFYLYRYISRLHEQDNWVLIPRTESSFVGRFGTLVGVEGVHPGLSLRIIPYAAAALRASVQDANLVARDPAQVNAGFDLKYGLTGTLTLDATINPDFGQVEVDPEVVNLSAYEVAFPEKRQFFLEGLDVFQPASSIIYTRRIGAAPQSPTPQHGGDIIELDGPARILAASKLTGNLRPGTAIGVLSAVTDETFARERVGPGPLSPTYRLQASPVTFWNAARIGQVVSDQKVVGLATTQVLRSNGQPDANVLAADFDLRGKSDFTAAADFTRSFTNACDPARTPTFHAKDNCDAYGADWWFGKTAGELKIWNEGQYYGADLQVNDLGYLAHLEGNQLIADRTYVVYRRPRVTGPFSDIWIDTWYQRSWDPNAGDPAHTNPIVDSHTALDVLLRLRNNSEVSWRYTYRFEHFDDAETRQNPHVRLYHRPAGQNLIVRARTPDIKALWAQVRTTLDEEGGTWIATPGADATWLAGHRVELHLAVAWTEWFNRPRWLATGDDGFPLIGSLAYRQLELTLRGTFAFTRTTTLQLYSQLLRASQQYGSLGSLRDPFTVVPCDPRGQCSMLLLPGAYNSDVSSFIVNSVFRWEYRPGSTLYLVYTHNHQLSGTSGDFRFGAAIGALDRTPADNVIAVKFTYLWAM
jgi:hypothetical protein